ncbi:MAG TPA: type II toxin-antitoxin system VapC family toxin [Desulfuromonadales bacterium]|nr:type II toxin-antitoxin system VapC family toxin [Desulfuromonadales bacterium]
MRYMLDTNICSYILKNHPASVKQKLEEVGAGNICISAIVLAELYYGAARHPKGIVIRREIYNFVSRLVVIPWDENAADHYGAIRASLEKTGSLVGAMDMLIAAHAMSCGTTLVTNNLREFDRIKGLTSLNWI